MQVEQEIQNLRILIKEVVKENVRASSILDVKKEQTEALAKRLSRLEEDVVILEKTREAFKYLIDNLVLEGVNKVENLLGYGLRTVFDDQQLDVRVDVTQKRGFMTMEVYLKDKACNVEAPIMGSFGGGPVAVVSFLLRSLALLNLGLRKVLILDETFSFVSEGYVPKLGRLLQILCKKTGVNILLVTHQKGFLDYCDRSIEVHQDSNGNLKSAATRISDYSVLET